MAGTAEVYYPDENCRFAEYVLRYAHEWKRMGEWGDDVDLVHWNAGLWDALELFGDGPLTSLDYYAEAIRRIDKRLRLIFPHAKIVFATSTSVIEPTGYSDFSRHNTTIEAFNATARKALAGTDTVIDDLYEATKDVPREYRSDWVHFYTPEGTEYIGGKVLSVICPLLGITPAEINIDSFTPERYSAASIGR